MVTQGHHIHDADPHWQPSSKKLKFLSPRGWYSTVVATASRRSCCALSIDAGGCRSQEARVRSAGSDRSPYEAHTRLVLYSTALLYAPMHLLSSGRHREARSRFAMQEHMAARWRPPPTPLRLLALDSDTRMPRKPLIRQWPARERLAAINHQLACCQQARKPAGGVIGRAGNGGNSRSRRRPLDAAKKKTLVRQARGRADAKC